MEDAGHLHELLEALESGVLVLERDSGIDPSAAIHRLFQSAHNLKSGLAMAGLERASKLFHGLEDGLDDIRRGRLLWSTAWADVVLELVDRIRTCLDEGQDDDLELPFVPPSAPKDQPSSQPALSSEEVEAGVLAASRGEHLFRIEKLFLPGLDRSDFEGHLIYDDISDNGTLVSVRPDWDGYSQAKTEVVVRFLFTSARTHEQLSELFFDPLIALPTQARFRLLVVDDNVLSIEIVRRTLEPFGEVTVAEDGAVGLAAFRKASDSGVPFDIVFLDLEMPEVDGHGALQGIRDYEEANNIQGLDRCLVFMHTSSADLGKVRVSFRLQADRYFIKPISSEKIQKRLQDSLPWLVRRRQGGV